MRVKATAIASKDLKPGDLFSNANQFYWNNYDPLSVGQKVYIRTESTTPPDQAEDIVYLIEIERER